MTNWKNELLLSTTGSNERLERESMWAFYERSHLMLILRVSRAEYCLNCVEDYIEYIDGKSLFKPKASGKDSLKCQREEDQDSETGKKVEGSLQKSD